MAKTYALVTGSTSGIGLSIAHQLAKKNYHIIFVSNEQERLKEVQAEFREKYQQEPLAIYLNLAEKDAAYTLFDQCKDLDVEVLVNNAGFFFFGMITGANLEKASAKIQLHIHTVALLCSLFGREMQKKRKGYILNNSSISAYKEFPGIGYYAGTKAFTKYFTQSLRCELRPYGIHVTCLLPGATATNLYDPNVVNIELAKKLGIMMSSDSVAYYAVKGLFANKSRVIPGITTKLMLWGTLLVPQWLIYQIRKLKPVRKVLDL